MGGTPVNTTTSGKVNLFHSFSSFDVGAGTAANFVVDSSVANILARVTSTTPSMISGTIESTLGIDGPASHANLFLINPAGVIFNQGSAVTIGGTFTVSTADSIVMNENSVFAVNPTGTQDSDLTSSTGLTTAPVTSFGFLGHTADTGLISVTGSTLSASEIQLLAAPKSGNPGVTITDSTLTATAGAVGIFAGTPTGANGGKVTYTSGTSLSYNNTSVSNFNFGAANSGVKITTGGGTGSSITSSSAGGSGHVVIRGGTLAIDGGSSITSTNARATTGDGISLDAAQIMLGNATTAGSVISANTNGGKGGAISVNTIAANPGSVSLTAGSQILSSTTGGGDAGDVMVNASTLTAAGSSTTATPLTGNVALNSAGLLALNSTTALTGIYSASDSAGAGMAGAVTVAASGTGAGTVALTQSAGIGSLSAGTGAAASGLVTVSSTGTLSLASGAQIASVTTGSETAASLMVSSSDTTASALSITGATGMKTGIFSQSSSGAFGNAGAVTVNATGTGGTLSLASGGTIGSISNGNGVGNAGAVSVAATGSLTIDGSQITSDTSSSNVTGAALTVSSAALTLTTSSELVTSSSGTGTAGSLTVNSSGLATPAKVTLTSGKITSTGGVSGAAGAVNVYAKATAGTTALTVTSGTEISSGNGQTVTVQTITGDINNGGTISSDTAGAVMLTSAGALTNGGSITAGGVTVTVGSLADTGSITSTSFGGVSVTSTGAAALSAGGTIKSTGGGNVTVLAKNTGANSLNIMGAGSGIFSDDSGPMNVTSMGTLSLSNGAVVSSETDNGNAAGAVTVTAGTLNLNPGTEIISTTTSAGDAGAIVVNDTTLSITGSSTTQSGIFSIADPAASSGNYGSAGTVTINSGTGDVSVTKSAQIASLSLAPDLTAPGSARDVTLNSATVGGSVTLEGDGTAQTIDQSTAVVYSFAANPYASSGNVMINAAQANVTITKGGSVETFTDNASVTAPLAVLLPAVTPGNVTVTAGNLVVNQNSTIQSVIGLDAPADIKSAASTGAVMVTVGKGSSGGKITIGSSTTSGDNADQGGSIRTVANSTNSGFGAGSAGQVTVLFNAAQSANLTEDGSHPTLVDGSFPTPEDPYISSTNLAGLSGGTSPLPIIDSNTPMPPPDTDIMLDGSSLGISIATVAEPVLNSSGSGYIVVITPNAGITEPGNNLFLSFTNFDLKSATETADFNVPATINNILVRVTSGQATTINGDLEATLTGSQTHSSANLFLLNPAGVIFGPHGSVADIYGAFTVVNRQRCSDGRYWQVRCPAVPLSPNRPE